MWLPKPIRSLNVPKLFGQADSNFTYTRQAVTPVKNINVNQNNGRFFRVDLHTSANSDFQVLQYLPGQCFDGGSCDDAIVYKDKKSPLICVSDGL